MRQRVDILKEACAYAVARWTPTDEASFCNIAVHHIATSMGYTGFRGMVANDITSHVKNSPDFAKVNAEAAQKLANDGRLVIACRKDEPHGHVAVCHPGELVYSNNFKAQAPQIANIGKTNGIFGANWGFATEPFYYAWIETV